MTIKERLRGIIVAIVDASGRRPLLVIAISLAALFGTWWYAYSHFALNADLLELLPHDSPGFRAFEHQRGRVGGGASLIVVVESPDRAKNERFIDALGGKLDAIVKEHAACEDKCGGKQGNPACLGACGPPLISYVESGTKDVRAFFQHNKWLYADLADLKEADQTLDHQIAIRSGSVVDLFADDDPKPAPKPAGSQQAPPPDQKPSFGIDAFKDRFERASKKNDDFPTGYFATPDGKMMAVRIVSTSRGLGDAGSDSLYDRVRTLVKEINPKSIDPAMEVGYAGDIPNAIEEKESLLTEAVWATGAAFVLIFVGIVFFFRSPFAPFVVALPACIGVGAAYSFAMIAYGYVNATGAFLGAIILGNGINYPIVLLNRYREFRARGMAPEEARREAVLNAFRAELVGSLVASIAYGSLVVTQFRGFNQFGTIGFVGMLLVWVTMIPCVPALLVVDDWIQARAPAMLSDKSIKDAAHDARGPIMRACAWATERAPWVFILGAAVATVLAVRELPSVIKDPWEYDGSKLGSRSTHVSGAGVWSNKADVVFGGKMNIAGALVLADTPEQVPAIKEAIFKNDAQDPQGKLVDSVLSIRDFLPDDVEAQKQKIEVLTTMRERLTPSVMGHLSPEERKTVQELTPPDDLKPIAPSDLPGLLKRRFEENDGRIGTVFYIRFRNDVSYSDGRILLRMAKTTNNVHLGDGVVVQTASYPTLFAEVIDAMRRDGPLATLVSFCAVVVVILFATSGLRGAFAVLSALVLAVIWTLGWSAHDGMKLNFFNFIALPITFGIGSEYPFNIFDRSRLLHGDVGSALRLSGGAVALCSYTTTVGYSSLLLADQQALQSFGKLAMTGEIACITAAVLYMPALLNILKRSKR